MIIMMMVPREDEVREYLSDMMLSAPGSVMERLETTRASNDQGRDLADMMLEEDGDNQPGVMGEGGDSDQPQDMDTGTTEEEATDTQVVNLLEIV